jgi:structure-specific recognition protein 1
MTDVDPVTDGAVSANDDGAPDADDAPSSKAQSYAWRHIGLHGAGMGSVLMHPQYFQWTSGASTKGANNNRRQNDDDAVTETRKIPTEQLKAAQWTVFGRHGYLRVQTSKGSGSSDKDGQKKNKNPVEFRFDGFPEADQAKLTEIWKDLYNIKMLKKNISASGASFGTTELEQGKLVFRESIVAEEEGEAESGEEIISLQLNEVSQCVLPGNNRNEIEMQFQEEHAMGAGAGETGSDQLVQIRFYVPPDIDADPTDKTAPTAAERMQQSIMGQANVRSSTGDVIAKFDETQGTFLTPRGRYTIELFAEQLRLRGNKYDYKIKYDDISRLFLLPKPDDFHMAFVIALEKPIRQGQQRYKYLVMQTNKQPSEIEILLEEKTLKKEYGGDLQPIMTGSLSNLLAKTFKVVTKKKVFVPGKFANANQHACVKCALKANEGLLYPLEKQFLFIHKPAVLVRFDEIESVEFQRYAGGQGSTRNFDLCVTLHQASDNVSADNSGTKEYIFSGIDRSDYTALYNFLSGKKIRVRNLASSGGSGSLSTFEEAMAGQPMAGGMIPPLQTAAAQAELQAAMAEMDAAEGEESSEDEDYNSGKEDGGDGGSESESIDPDDLSDEDPLSDDSDIAEYRKAAKKQAKKEGKPAPVADVDKKRKSAAAAPKETKKKPKAAASPVKAETKKKVKVKKDPNAPKRPTTAYFYFMNEHRERIKSEHPDATFGETGKILGEEYKKITPEEKTKYEELNVKDKTRYAKEMEVYNAKKKAEGGGVDSMPEKKPKSKATVPKKKAAPAAAKPKKKKEADDDESAAGSDDDDDESEAESDEDSE